MWFVAANASVLSSYILSKAFWMDSSRLLETRILDIGVFFFINWFTFFGLYGILKEGDLRKRDVLHKYDTHIA